MGAFLDLHQYASLAPTRKPVINLKCDKPRCGGVLRENLLALSKDAEPRMERDDARWYFIKCPACRSPYRLPPNSAHVPPHSAG